MKPGRQKNYDANMSILRESGIDFETANNGVAVLIRFPIVVDFFPSTNKWRYNNETFFGDAKKLIRFIGESASFAKPRKQKKFDLSGKKVTVTGPGITAVRKE